jgi:hypothetical protein
VAIADPENHFMTKYQRASSDAIGIEYADIVGLLGAGGSDRNGNSTPSGSCSSSNST